MHNQQNTAPTSMRHVKSLWCGHARRAGGSKYETKYKSQYLKCSKSFSYCDAIAWFQYFFSDGTVTGLLAFFSFQSQFSKLSLSHSW